MDMLLHDSLCYMGLSVCIVSGAWSFLWLLCDRYGGFVNILDSMIVKAQKRREKRRMTAGLHVENIPGTNGYRIKTR